MTEQQRVSAKRTLVVAELGASFNVVTTVKGGGVSAQADAVKMGIARALVEFNPELRKLLKAEGLMTRRCAPRRNARSTGRRARESGSSLASARAFASY